MIRLPLSGLCRDPVVQCREGGGQWLAFSLPGHKRVAVVEEEGDT